MKPASLALFTLALGLATAWPLSRIGATPAPSDAQASEVREAACPAERADGTVDPRLLGLPPGHPPVPIERLLPPGHPPVSHGAPPSEPDALPPAHPALPPGHPPIPASPGALPFGEPVILET